MKRRTEGKWNSLSIAPGTLADTVKWTFSETYEFETATPGFSAEISGTIFKRPEFAPNEETVGLYLTVSLTIGRSTFQLGKFGPFTYGQATSELGRWREALEQGASGLPTRSMLKAKRWKDSTIEFLIRDGFATEDEETV